MEHLKANGLTVQVEERTDLTPIKQQYGIDATLESCHTAIVDGYVIEGHVPAQEIQRLLAERPAITGLAVPGMPIGSPGMEIVGYEAEPYAVIAFTDGGEQQVFANYP